MSLDHVINCIQVKSIRCTQMLKYSVVVFAPHELFEHFQLNQKLEVTSFEIPLEARNHGRREVM